MFTAEELQRIKEEMLATLESCYEGGEEDDEVNYTEVGPEQFDMDNGEVLLLQSILKKIG